MKFVVLRPISKQNPHTTPPAELAKPLSLSRACPMTRQPVFPKTTPVRIPGTGAGPRSSTRSTRSLLQTGGSATASRKRLACHGLRAAAGRPSRSLRSPRRGSPHTNILSKASSPPPQAPGSSRKNTPHLLPAAAPADLDHKNLSRQHRRLPIKLTRVQPIKNAQPRKLVVSVPILNKAHHDTMVVI